MQYNLIAKKYIKEILIFVFRMKKISHNKIEEDTMKGIPINNYKK